MLAAVDPAQPYGAALPWPKRRGEADARRPQRVAGAQVVLVGAEPVVYLERSGKGLVTLVAEDDSRLHPALEALADDVRAGRVRRIGIERVNGEPIADSPLAAVLIELGFRQSPRALTLSA